ncbi:alpha/beta hydrolase [Paracoccus versutus]|uniref:alpha/beta hydrolase n=1 Tax=Paracoccus versutus TaxID=34007 RepID=UPI001AD7EFA9|nr:alpha/beta hydrolase [Paracoccus versutus]
MKLTQTWDKTFTKGDKVSHCKVTITNRYGMTPAGDLYTPQGDGPFAAIAVSGPFGAVKEQSSGPYAQTLAERGERPYACVASGNLDHRILVTLTWLRLNRDTQIRG